MDQIYLNVELESKGAYISGHLIVRKPPLRIRLNPHLTGVGEMKKIDLGDADHLHRCEVSLFLITNRLIRALLSLFADSQVTLQMLFTIISDIQTRTLHNPEEFTAKHSLDF